MRTNDKSSLVKISKPTQSILLIILLICFGASSIYGQQIGGLLEPVDIFQFPITLQSDLLPKNWTIYNARFLINLHNEGGTVRCDKADLHRSRS